MATGFDQAIELLRSSPQGLQALQRAMQDRLRTLSVGAPPGGQQRANELINMPGLPQNLDPNVLGVMGTDLAQTAAGTQGINPDILAQLGDLLGIQQGTPTPQPTFAPHLGPAGGGDSDRKRFEEDPELGSPRLRRF